MDVEEIKQVAPNTFLIRCSSTVSVLDNQTVNPNV